MSGGFGGALRFLTILPAPGRKDHGTDFAITVGYFPLVGLLLGLVLCGMYLGLTIVFPAFLAAVLVLAAWVILTGALHVDGLMDCCDALFAPRSRVERLRIMKDAAVGSFGLSGAFLVLLSKLAAIASLGSIQPARLVSALVLVCSPLFGRFAMLYSMARFPAARESGLGRAAKSAVRPRHLIVNAVLCGAAILCAAAIHGTIALAAAVCAAIGAAELAGRFAVRRIGGVTGDVFGATCELAEAAALLAPCVFLRLGVA